MEIHFQCNLEDYDEALRGQRSARRMPIIILVGFVLFFVGEVIAVNLGVRQGVASLVVIVFCLTLSLAIAIARPLWVKKDFHGHPNFGREQTLQIDDNGLHWTNEVGQNDTQWTAYTKYRETQNLFLFYLGNRVFQVVPKRALSDKERNELRQLLRTRLPADRNSTEREKTSAFSE